MKPHEIEKSAHIGGKIFSFFCRFCILALLVQLTGCPPINRPPSDQSAGRIDFVLVDGREARPDETRGVSVIRNGRYVSVAVPMELKRGDEILTDGRTEAILNLSGGTQITLGRDIHIRLVNPWHILEILSDIGSFFVETESSLTIDTEYVAAGVEGTRFMVNMYAGGTIVFSMLEGRLRLESKRKAWRTKWVSAYQKATVQSGNEPWIDRLGREEINGIERWKNNIERAYGNRNQARLMPDVTGLFHKEAARIMRENGIGYVYTKEDFSAKMPAGYVLEQYPKAGTRFSPGKTTVTLVVNRTSGQQIEPQGGERDRIRVPGVVGKQIHEALEYIHRAGLKEGQIVERKTGKDMSGMVIEQSPRNGEWVPRGTSVMLVISASSPVQDAVVPYVVGRHIDEARNSIQRAGLRTGPILEQRTGKGRPGTVVDQKPGGGQRVPRETSVALYVEKDGITVPDLKGQHVDKARYMLENVGLQLRMQRVETRKEPADTIIWQNPGPGTVVDHDYAVQVGIATPPIEQQPGGVRPPIPPKNLRTKICVVPDVMRMHKDKAMYELSKAGFKPVIERQYEGDTVYRQYPGPNAKAICGSEVKLTIGWIK